MSDLSATIASALIGGTISAATGGKFANGAVTGAMQMAMGRVASNSKRAAQMGDEPENVSDDVRVNRRFRKNISVSCVNDECDVSLKLTIGGDGLVTDETVKYARRDIARFFSGGFVYGSRVYSVSTEIKIVDSRPDLLVSAVIPNSNEYPGGQAYLGYGNVLELGFYGAGTASHEFGHLLGLSHQWNHTSSLMSYALNRTITGMDIDRIARAYGPRR